MKEKFYYYREFYDVVKAMDLKLRDELNMALFEYALNGNLRELSPLANGYFVYFKKKIDANNARGKNGFKGGRPRKVVEQIEG